MIRNQFKEEVQEKFDPVVIRQLNGFPLKQSLMTRCFEGESGHLVLAMPPLFLWRPFYLCFVFHSGDCTHVFGFEGGKGHCVFVDIPNGPNEVIETFERIYRGEAVYARMWMTNKEQDKWHQRTSFCFRIGGSIPRKLVSFVKAHLKIVNDHLSLSDGEDLLE